MLCARHLLTLISKRKVKNLCVGLSFLDVFFLSEYLIYSQFTLTSWFCTWGVIANHGKEAQSILWPLTNLEMEKTKKTGVSPNSTDRHHRYRTRIWMYLFKFVKAKGFLLARENPFLKHTLNNVLCINFYL